MNTLGQSKVLGAGLIALDLVVGPDPDAPVRCWAGGTCGNVLSILAYLGWDAYPVARMNSDVASRRVCADMLQWGMHLDWAKCAPTASTPMIVQEIRRCRDGRARHRFRWSCPHCGSFLPPFKAIRAEAVERVKAGVEGTSVFFFDRVSRGILELAAKAASCGAVVVFEPSSRGTDQLLREALKVAHIVKYAGNRLKGIGGVMGSRSATLVEVQTLGEQGLRYRHRLGRGGSRWMHLNAVPAPRLVDACGSGDWCTAGLIARVATGGQDGLRRGGARAVRAALRFGQGLAAWNCGFEGARGGMYAISREEFNSQVGGLLGDNSESVVNEATARSSTEVATCPACPDTGRPVDGSANG